jgi:uncharacterized protein
VTRSSTIPLRLFRTAQDRPLKFQPDTLDGVNNITRYDVDSLRVNADLHTASVLVPWVGQARAWNATRVEDLTPAHFEALLEFDPEVVIFGSGSKLKFVSPALYRSLIARRIGVETMDSGAACRTYTVLANEGRRVVAAILLTPAN